MRIISKASRSLWILIFSLFLVSISFAQRTVTGTVTSADDKEPLPGATIQVKGTTSGTITDIEGNYSINVSEDDILIFSYVGFRPKEISVGNQSVINVAMQLDLVAMDEVVVVGYGTVSKSDLTGSVSSVRGKDLIKVPAANPLQALQGKVAGVNVSSESGEPGSNPVVRVRGVGTLNNASPIFVVDGVILDDISFLNTNDIESIEVLKDASATAIYGSRGANGVFIVTTKGGISRDQQSRISYKQELSVQRLQQKIDLLDGREFATAYNEIFPGTFNNLDVLPDTDWQDEVFRENPLIQSYDLSFSGGSENLSYYLGGGVFSNEGIIPKSDFKRYTFKLNTTFTPKSYLTLGSNISGAYFDDDAAPGVVFAVYGAWPIDEPFDENGNFQEVRGTSNPLASIEYTNNNTKRYRLVANNYVELDFLKYFTIKSSYQIDFLYSKGTSYNPEFFVSAVQQNQDETLTVSFGESRNWIWENTLNYSQELGKHRVSGLFGLTYQETFNEFPAFSYRDLINASEDFWYLNATNSPNDSVQVSDYSPERFAIQSFIGRANYSYDNRYLFTGTLRFDGSSKFSEENRWGAFPSIALGWNMHNEAFYNLGPVQTLKIRGSWGIIGNDKIGVLDRFSIIDANSGAVFGRNEVLLPGSTYGSPGNNNLVWEETQQLNIGAEFGLFDDRITAEVDYYNKKTKDILVDLTAPGYLGYGAFIRARFNAATVINQGVEFNVVGRQQWGDLNLTLGINGSTVRNEVETLGANIPVDSVITSGSILGNLVTVTVPGEPIGAFYGYDVIGVYQDQQDLDRYPSLAGRGIGDLIYKDTNGDGELNSEDKVIIGSAIPDFIYGFSLQGDYRNFSLSLDFNGTIGNEIYNGKNQNRFSVLNFEGDVRDRWTPSNPSNTEPRLTTRARNLPPSEYYIEDGSYLRLRSATFSYEITSPFFTNLGISDFVVYVRGTNLFTLTKYSGYSPEIGSGDPLAPGIDRGIYPITSVYTLGLNLSF